MKLICIVACFFVLLQGAWSQATTSGAPPPAAQDVSAMEWEVEDRSTYKNAVAFWKSMTEAYQNNEDAWLNYYKALRSTVLLADGASPNKKHQAELDQVIGHIANAVPTGYAFQYCNYVNGNKSDESFQYLHAAYKLRPSDTELWDDMLCDAVLSGDQATIQLWVRKIADAKLFSWAELEYNRNTLNSVEANGVLITNGNLDTSPLIMLQSGGFRKDVTVVCLDWIGSARNLHRLEAQLVVKPGVIKLNDRSATLASLVQLQSSKAIYLAFTLPSAMLTNYKDHLYCTGLAMKYSAGDINNVQSLVYNWEQLFQKSYLANADAISRNYLVPAHLLLQYYTDIGDNTKRNEMQQLIAQKKTIEVQPYIQK